MNFKSLNCGVFAAAIEVPVGIVAQVKTKNPAEMTVIARKISQRVGQTANRAEYTW